VIRCKVCKSPDVQERRSTWWKVNEDEPDLESETGESVEQWCDKCERERGAGSDQGFEEWCIEHQSKSIFPEGSPTPSHELCTVCGATRDAGQDWTHS